MDHAEPRAPRVMRVAAAAMVALPLAGGCGGEAPEQSAQEKQESARTTVQEYLAAQREGDFERTCSLVAGEVTPDEISAPTDAQRAACANRARNVKDAAILRKAEVGEVIDEVSGSGDVEGMVIAVKGAPRAQVNPAYGAPAFWLVGPNGQDACGREWCIIAPVPPYAGKVNTPLDAWRTLRIP